MDKNTLATRAKMAFNALLNADIKAEKDLINILKDFGGIIRTPLTDGKPTLYSYTCWNDREIQAVPIQAVAYDEGEGLMVLTNCELESYEYSEGYEFQGFHNLTGEDEKRYLEATEDITYFRVLDDGYTDVNTTIFSILAGLEYYLA